MPPAIFCFNSHTSVLDYTNISLIINCAVDSKPATTRTECARPHDAHAAGRRIHIVVDGHLYLSNTDSLFRNKKHVFKQLLIKYFFIRFLENYYFYILSSHVMNRLP